MLYDTRTMFNYVKFSAGLHLSVQIVFWGLKPAKFPVRGTHGDCRAHAYNESLGAKPHRDQGQSPW